MADQSQSKTPTDSTSYFAALAKDDAIKAVENSLPEVAKVSDLFMAGDHWQGGAGWVGPIPDLEDPDYGITLDLIKQAFTSRNAIKEIVQRHMRGVVGEEPTFGVVPRQPLNPGDRLEDAKLARKREIEAALTDWWDTRRAHLAVQKAAGNSTWATRGVLRLYVPRGKLAGGVIPKQPDLASALALIYLDAPDPKHSAVVVDEDTKDEAGILVTEIDGKKQIEMTFLGPDTAAPGAPADPKNPRLTMLRTITDDEDTTIPVSFGGRTTMFAIERELLITEQIQQMQRALNLCLSMIPRNVVTGGFLERIILNALPPGHWKTDARGRKIQFVRDPWSTGPGTTQWVRGIELPQKDGSVQLTTPSVSNRDPVDTKPADEAKRAIYRDMLEEADQAHVLVTGETMPSGKSRQEGRSDFEVSLTETEAPTNAAGRWLIETILSMAEQFMQQPGSVLNDWRGQFECMTNSGPVTVDERKQVLSELDAGLISEETAMSRIGVIDVQAEQDRILAQNGGKNLGLLKRQFTIIALACGAIAALDVVAELAGIDAATAKKLLGTLGDGGTAIDPNTGLPVDPNANPNPNPAPTPQGGPANAGG